MNDPEQRIAELERQLSHPRPRSTTQASDGWLTPEDVHHYGFSLPPTGKRGYHEDEVDAFLDRIEQQLRNPGAGLLTADQVREVAFSKPPFGKRGYDVDEVDAFLDFVEQQLSPHRGAPPPLPRTRSRPKAPHRSRVRDVLKWFVN